MPWVSELFTAPVVARYEDEHREERVIVPYYAGLLTGETDALAGSFRGEPEVHDPTRGRIKGAAAFTAYVKDMNEWFGERHTFAERNALYVETAVKLGCEAATRALERAQLTPRDVDHVVFVSSTGLSTPSIDALIANRIDFRSNVRRTPIWGLGCAGGAAGLSRARDFALADPNSRVLLVALELCTLTFLNGDISKRNLVAASLFGDGAAAVVVAGANVKSSGNHRPLALRASQSTLWPDTVDVMGWELEQAGLRVVFSRSIPHIVMEHVPANLETFLSSQGLALGDVRHVIAHPGGIKVLRAYKDALELTGLADRSSPPWHRPTTTP